MFFSRSPNAVFAALQLHIDEFGAGCAGRAGLRTSLSAITGPAEVLAFLAGDQWFGILRWGDHQVVLNRHVPRQQRPASVSNTGVQQDARASVVDESIMRDQRLLDRPVASRRRIGNAG